MLIHGVNKIVVGVDDAQSRAPSPRFVVETQSERRCREISRIDSHPIQPLEVSVPRVHRRAFGPGKREGVHEARSEDYTVVT